ncbi:MAG: 9-O-acetylesterase [Lentisphaeria bacterium]|nr:9-O-acetylesterase [Lentisphaeria bacterium]
MHRRLSEIAAALVALATLAARAELTLPTIFSDHMVLQREEPIPVWGWETPGQAVTVLLGNESAQALAGADGAWAVRLRPRSAGGVPLTLAVRGSSERTVEDILVGEVWLCSGQSNMQWLVRSSLRPEEEQAAAGFPSIRHITVPRVPAGLPQRDLPACDWKVCSPETVLDFSAAAYFFGRELHRDLGVPIGLINSSWGGTRIEPWTPLSGFEGVAPLQSIVDRVYLTLPDRPEHKAAMNTYLEALTAWLAGTRQAVTREQPVEPPPAFPQQCLLLKNHQDPTVLYNAMVHGAVPFGIRGAIWYQGESNHGEGMLYLEKMKALIEGWRQVWGKPALPFYFVQIAPYQYGNENPEILPRFWEAQNAAAQLPGVGMAVIHDVGDITNIHPMNKQEVGRRLALLALARTYGREGIVWSGPVFREMRIEEGRLRLSFDHAENGLASRDGKPLTWFEVIDAEGEDFVQAQAVIEGKDILVSAPEAPRPVAVRFGWHKTAEPNLMNRDGLPGAPFRAGNVPVIDYLQRHVPEASGYTLVYDLDLASLGATVTYAVDRRAEVRPPFDRVAYFLELRKPDERTQWVYVSMKAFTDDLARIGVPTLASKAHFQTRVEEMNVLSNAPGITSGTGLGMGYIEFWPHNYGPQNAGGVPGASNDVWDFGDGPSDPVDGYGSMQVHNAEARQTLFAINHWKAAGGADIGIGNSPDKPVVPGGNATVSRTRDWTFQGNAAQYATRRLRVLVRPVK